LASVGGWPQRRTVDAAVSNGLSCIEDKKLRLLLVGAMSGETDAEAKRRPLPHAIYARAKECTDGHRQARKRVGGFVAKWARARPPESDSAPSSSRTTAVSDVSANRAFLDKGNLAGQRDLSAGVVGQVDAFGGSYNDSQNQQDGALDAGDQEDRDGVSPKPRLTVLRLLAMLVALAAATVLIALTQTGYRASNGAATTTSTSVPAGTNAMGGAGSTTSVRSSTTTEMRKATVQQTEPTGSVTTVVAATPTAPQPAVAVPTTLQSSSAPSSFTISVDDQDPSTPSDGSFATRFWRYPPSGANWTSGTSGGVDYYLAKSCQGLYVQYAAEGLAAGSYSVSAYVPPGLEGGSVVRGDTGSQIVQSAGWSGIGVADAAPGYNGENYLSVSLNASQDCGKPAVFSELRLEKR
jgi:hypothetical protein